jgi:hypothetical protein
MSTSLYFYVGFLQFNTIFSMFSEPNRGLLGFRTEPNSEPNRPTFVKNCSEPSEIKNPFRIPLIYYPIASRF